VRTKNLANYTSHTQLYFHHDLTKRKDKNHLDAAFSAFNKAIMLDPNDSVTYVNRGIAFRKKGDWDHAIADYNKAIGLDPKPDWYGHRGYAYLEKSYH
jgi:tetratricopeptide (TPR) repeat protein